LPRRFAVGLSLGEEVDDREALPADVKGGGRGGDDDEDENHPFDA
jgi:hypothetical protein